MKSDTLIRFNWFEILKEANQKRDKALAILKELCIYEIPKRGSLQLYSKIKNNPDCWLSDKYNFFKTISTDMDKCIYLHIATKRNWLDYSTQGITYVPIYIIEIFYNIESLKYNPLLKINDNYIDLIY